MCFLNKKRNNIETKAFYALYGKQKELTKLIDCQLSGHLKIKHDYVEQRLTHSISQTLFLHSLGSNLKEIKKRMKVYEGERERKERK